MTKVKNKVITLAMALVLTGAAALAVPSVEAGPAQSPRVQERIRKQLATLPYYGVFDNLAFKMEGDTVTLYGQVRRPSTRKDAERRVAKIEGIERVVNNIEVLPLSTFDDNLRARAYRAIFRTGGLHRYSMGANPSIHIVVNRGHITLEGVVSSKMDSQLAYMAANQVPGAFSVTNNLRIERES